MSIEHPIRHDDPDISVVIPTVPSNSHDQVVADLRRQTYDAFEVIVVNDGERDICEARNAGIDESRANIVALTDDDCRPPKQWVELILEVFRANPDLICLEGSVRGGREYNGKRKYVGCNLAFDRDTAVAIGGFNSTYAGWRDDTEFGWRMERDASGKCDFDPRVVMDHPDTPRATIDKEIEANLRRDFPNRYEEVIVPNTIADKLNDWLWRKGFWDAVDSIRYDR